MWLIILLVLALCNTSLIADSVYQSILMFGTSLLPSLFFFTFLSDVIIKHPFFEKASFFIFSLFHRILPFRYPKSLLIFFLSFLIGNPGTTKAIISMYEAQEIDCKEAMFLIKTTSSFSLGFYFSFIYGYIFSFNNQFWILFSVPIITNIFLCFFYFNGSKYSSINSSKKSFQLGKDLIDSLDKTKDIMLLILSSTIIFGVIIDLLMMLYPNMYLAGFLEVSRGLKNMMTKIDLPMLLFSAFFLSFGGLSIHIQVYYVIQPHLPYYPFFKSRIIAGLISVLLMFSIYILVK